MKIIILQLLFLIASADKRCRGIYFNDQYYNVNIIKEGVNNINNLVYNRNDNTIYFTFDEIADIPTKMLGYLNMDTNTVNVIEGIRNATAIAIDQKKNNIYVGGSDGLFKINDKKIPEKLPIQDDITYLHFNNGLYFTNTRQEAFKFEDGFATVFPELQGLTAQKILIDNDNNVFFVQERVKLFRIKVGTHAVDIHEGHEVSALANDVHSKAYVCSDKGVFVYNRYKYVLDKVADLTKLKALTFNAKNEPIYAVNDLIVKLSVNPLPCFED